MGIVSGPSSSEYLIIAFEKGFSLDQDGTAKSPFEDLASCENVESAAAGQQSRSSPSVAADVTMREGSLRIPDGSRRVFRANLPGRAELQSGTPGRLRKTRRSRE
jgi:hypothetical protein